MDTYLLLLRGVNVGGKNRVPMSELKALLEENNFSDVVTYINSGNIIFSYHNSTPCLLKIICEELIFSHFQLPIPVAVLTDKELILAVKKAPSWWDTGQDQTHNAVVLIPPVTADEVIFSMGEMNSNDEKIALVENILFSSVPLATYSRSKWSKLAKSEFYKNMTIRNANTMKKLATLINQ